ncbi:MAG TPA: SDR family oxidoreductase [Spirochaetia bacterium]|nr:SDR family oxidoreductase [Spirochaetia bacterium]
MSYIEEMFGLDGKTVVITGGGGAIAGAMSEAILRAGARLALWDIVPEALDAAKARLSESTGKGDRIVCQVVDTMKEESVREAVEQTEKGLAAPNVLINAAGGNRGKSSFIETDMSQFEFVLKLNLVAGLMVPTKVMAAYWIDKGIKGAVVNLASMASYIPLSGVWAYDAAKAAVMNLTMAAAKEFAPQGIRVNAIAPGFFIGKQNKDLLIKNDKTGELTERGKTVIDHTPFGRFGDVSELEGVLIFLVSDKAAGFVTGITVPVDGGYLVHNI